MMRCRLGLVSLVALFGCAAAQPSEAPGSSASSSSASPAASAAAESDQWTAAAEGDPALARALLEARHLELQRGVPAERKSRAWQAAVDLAGEKPIGAEAADRAMSWSRVADAEERRPEMLASLRAAYAQDVARTQAGQLGVKEFCAVYGQLAHDLEELKVTPRLKTICPGD